MPTYEYMCENCKHEWEEVHSMKLDPIKRCPECKKDCAKRLISGGSGKGKVVLAGNELREKLMNDAQDIKRQASTDENVLANIIGEQKYEQKKKNDEAVNKEKIHLSKHFKRSNVKK